MPSYKNPASIVNPGPGRLPAGTVPANALLFPVGSGGDISEELQAHIHQTIDAHLASAIGVNPYNAAGMPILTSVGGVVDGENMLDFIDAVRDLYPVRADQLGYNDITVPNNGLIDWNILQPGEVGAMPVNAAFSRGLNVIGSKNVINHTGTVTIWGTVFPADRGVLAFYSSTDGDYTNPATLILRSALWLGSNPPPAGIPSANFDETFRHGQQTSRTATGVGLDKVTFEDRVPYLKDYTGYTFIFSALSPYSANFYHYQLGRLTGGGLPNLIAGDSGSYLVVHWKETYATTLAKIQPATAVIGLTNQLNCYSAVSTTGNAGWDTGAPYQVNRREIFTDLAATAPSGHSFTTSWAAGYTPTLLPLSGVNYDKGLPGFIIDLQIDHLWNNSYYRSVAAGDARDPVTLDLTGIFGSPTGLVVFPYDSMHNVSTPLVPYSATNGPQPTDRAEINWTGSAVGSGYSFGIVSISAQLAKPFFTPVTYTDTTHRYLYNNYPQTVGGGAISTDVLEPFTDELHRYALTANFDAPAKSIIPAGGDVYNSSHVLAAHESDLQLIPFGIVYPQMDFGAGDVLPVGGPNYSLLPGSDGLNHVRRYVRAFDTGVPRNTGKFVISASLANALVDALFDGNETTGHIDGGMILQLKVPGVTGWLDLGRAKGDPDLSTVDYHGCKVSLVGNTITYDTTGYTVNNGSGKFLIWLRVCLFNNAAGRALTVGQITWQAP
jgi:hypothetical protein